MSCECAIIKCMSNAQQTPAEIDTQLAEQHSILSAAIAKIERAERTIIAISDPEYYYQGRQRVTNRTYKEARVIVDASISPEDSDYKLLTGGYSVSHVRHADATIVEQTLVRDAAYEEINRLNDLYTGWSRFFVVTSSNGHIHSSMACSTCRPTTTFGWLPELSGKDQAEAIAFFGPAAEALCSVCFPDAPTLDRNLTVKERDAILAGETPEAAKPVCPGSGRYAENGRQGYAAGNWNECPVCHEHVGGKGHKVRKHAPKVSA